MFDSVRSEGRGIRPRWQALAGLAVLALALHAWLLHSVAGAASSPAPLVTTAVRVRTLTAPTPTSAALPTQAAPTTAHSTSATSFTPSSTPAPRAAVAPPAGKPPPLTAAAPEPEPEPAPAPVAVADAAEAAPATPLAIPPSDAAGAESAASAPPPQHVPSVAEAASGRASDDETPVYRTLVPPPVTLRYGLRRGMLSGSGELLWRPDGDRYEARLEGKVAGVSVLTQVSQGGFDHAGLAPLRFTDQRLRGAVRAANFQRERGEITFSGPSDVLTLLIGTQDRLSWMIQLAAIVSAEPQRLAAGGKVVMHVVGARADGAVWIFRSRGAESVDTDAGPVNAVKFVRESRKAYDTQVEAWLDPARHHLPVRARLVSGSEGDALELLLHDMLQPP